VLNASRDAMDMQLMPGTSLLQLLHTKSKPPVSVRLKLCVEILRVVMRIQNLQIVHRDVSNPANWIVDGALDVGGALKVGLVDPDFSVPWFPGLLQHIKRSWTQPHTPENQTARGAKVLDQNEVRRARFACDKLTRGFRMCTMWAVCWWLFRCGQCCRRQSR